MSDAREGPRRGKGMSDQDPAMTMFVCGDGSQGCPKRPGALDHDWSGAAITEGREVSATCKLCGISFAAWAPMHLA